MGNFTGSKTIVNCTKLTLNNYNPNCYDAIIVFYRQQLFIVIFFKISNKFLVILDTAFNLTTLNISQKSYHSRSHFQQTSITFLLMEDP